MSESAAHMNYKELYEASLQMNQQLLKSLEQQQQSNQNLQEQVTQLQYQLQQLTKLLKGFKSERFVPVGTSRQQPELGFVMEVVDPSTDLADAKKISYTKLKKSATQQLQDTGTKLPDHLRRETTVLEPKEDVSDCVKVGEEVRETLSWQPGEVFVNRIVIPVYSRQVAAKPGKEVIIKSPLPIRAIGKCLADPALLAQITVDKLVDHKPLNRQLESLIALVLYCPTQQWLIGLDQ